MSKITHRLPTRAEYLTSDIFSTRDKLYWITLDNGAIYVSPGCRFAGSFDTKSEAENNLRKALPSIPR
jgi:hypothetical protein